MSYSNSGGGTLTLPSPTHAHHVDVTSAVRSLRRSLSRSPSKFRLVPKKSPSSSPQSPLSPSPASPPKRASTHNSLFAGFSGNPPHTPSPLAVPFPPSAKLALRSASRPKPIRSSSRTRTSPRSPMKRALSSSSDSGNAPSSSLSPPSVGQENTVTSPIERKSFERIAKMPFNLDSAGPMNFALSRLGSDGTNEGHQTSSPLKRSDAIMNLDQASLGSPVAKRRSLHGSSFSQEFNVFDHGPIQPFEILEDQNSEHVYELSTSSITSDSNSSFLPRRSSSLRKSTLQQRHGEKTSWGRRYAAQLAAQQQLATIKADDEAEVSTPVKERMRPRLSLDQFVAPLPRDSPFNSQGSLPNASMHMLNHVPHQPHPLSRTMTTSSSSSSLAEESPTHVPVHFNDHPRPKLDFAKSLPAGSLRPFSFGIGSGDNDFSTPQNYKSVKPHPAAFASTGLISKVNRNPEIAQVPRGLSKLNVPDTPCKKFTGQGAFATYPANIPGSALVKARNLRHSFGTPSTPFNFHGNTPAPTTFGKPTNIFGSSFGNKGLSRRNSFMSMDGYESGGSPDGKDNSQEAEYPPPTPTKSVFAPQPESPSSHRSLQASNPAFDFGFSRRIPRTSSKLNLSTSPGYYQGDEESDDSMDINDSPTTAHGRVLKSSDTFPSLSRSHTHRNLNEASPMLLRSHSVAFETPLIKKSFAKFNHPAPASPLERIDLGIMEHPSPHTPRDNAVVPPDPSGLSISNPRDRDTQAATLGGLSTSMPPPATPTTGREYFLAMGDRRQSTTPVSTFAAPDIDPALTSRFEKVELIGTGEFSTVYKVTKNTSLNISSYFSQKAGSHRSSPNTPSIQQVYAVKKAKLPFRGPADRAHKMQEVNTLKALGQTENVIHYLDSWEVHSYLYIQTEYCEEGSLDMFLSQAGRKGRLDDFRIWKIMLEISMGLRHIHESGYIHLDLKPANVFITFEGTLKIGDFGMASSWPAQAGIEGEGDREYIGPEILLGKFDKPADVFSLGLIMFEIAANVQLPDNGPNWQRLRSGDISDVSSLTWSAESSLQRDATGIPMDDSDISMDTTFGSDDEMEPGFGSPTLSTRKRNCGGGSSRSLSHDAGNLFGSSRRGELHRAPEFMTNPYHECSMDKLVKWMISPEPQDRPQISQVLEAESLRWVASRRRAGATVYEGNWGPADELLGDDAEMLDV